MNLTGTNERIRIPKKRVVVERLRRTIKALSHLSGVEDMLCRIFLSQKTLDHLLEGSEKLKAFRKSKYILDPHFWEKPKIRLIP